MATPAVRLARPDTVFVFFCSGLSSVHQQAINCTFKRCSQVDPSLADHRDPSHPQRYCRSLHSASLSLAPAFCGRFSIKQPERSFQSGRLIVLLFSFMRMGVLYAHCSLGIPWNSGCSYPMPSKQLFSKRMRSLSPLFLVCSPEVSRTVGLSSLCWYISSLSQLSLPCQGPLHILSSQYWSSCSPLDITSLRLRKSVLSCVWRNLAAKVGHIFLFQPLHSVKLPPHQWVVSVLVILSWLGPVRALAWTAGANFSSVPPVLTAAGVAPVIHTLHEWRAYPGIQTWQRLSPAGPLASSSGLRVRSGAGVGFLQSVTWPLVKEKKKSR